MTFKRCFFVIILGPTATILAYDLYKNQRRALDFRHIVNSYDFYMKNHLRFQSYPFDWLTNASLKNRLELIINNFADFMNIADLK
ncbi:MAG: DUF1796 family putative cysteine peptidase, partial [Alphaproteobacteria bacterium]